jgi:hypothetical protein
LNMIGPAKPIRTLYNLNLFFKRNILSWLSRFSSLYYFLPYASILCISLYTKSGPTRQFFLFFPHPSPSLGPSVSPHSLFLPAPRGGGGIHRRGRSSPARRRSSGAREVWRLLSGEREASGWPDELAEAAEEQASTSSRTSSRRTGGAGLDEFAAAAADGREGEAGPPRRGSALPSTTGVPARSGSL